MEKLYFLPWSLRLTWYPFFYNQEWPMQCVTTHSAWSLKDQLLIKKMLYLQSYRPITKRCFLNEDFPLMTLDCVKIRNNKTQQQKKTKISFNIARLHFSQMTPDFVRLTAATAKLTNTGRSISCWTKKFTAWSSWYWICRKKIQYCRVTDLCIVVWDNALQR